MKTLREKLERILICIEEDIGCPSAPTESKDFDEGYDMGYDSALNEILFKIKRALED